MGGVAFRSPCYLGVIVFPFFEIAKTVEPPRAAPVAPETPPEELLTIVSWPPVENAWVPIRFRSTISLPAAYVTVNLVIGFRMVVVFFFTFLVVTLSSW